MAEGGSRTQTHQVTEKEIIHGSVNIRQAHENSDILEKSMEDARECLLTGQNDALSAMIREWKKHISNTWNDMVTADPEIVIASIQDPTGTSLQDYITEKGVTTSDPEAEIPTVSDITRELPQQQNEKEITELCVSLFDHMSEATGHISAAMANLSTIAKCTDYRTFQTILQVSV